ncbi:MAG: hypothetical protein ACK6DP_10865 [Gemmatimonas sp.]|uniref:hypothetical protein n=1 Tax=Gemmatimonas sp. TaxID=1962908 RepID=UPI00391F170A
MSDQSNTLWRGRLRLSSPARDVPRRESPLTETEREALEIWMPRGSHILAHTRGRRTRDGLPVWVVANEGILAASLIDEDADRLRARVHWIPASKVRRIDALCHGDLAVVRLETLGRGYVLHGNDQESATRFVALSRAVVQLAARRPQQRPLPLGEVS